MPALRTRTYPLLGMALGACLLGGLPGALGETVTAADDTQPRRAAAQDPSPRLTTPEDAVREYLAGVADADVERILAATAVGEISTSARFDLLVERLDGFYPTMQFAPAGYPFFADITNARLTGDILDQVRFLAYGLLSDEPIGDAIVSTEMEQDPRSWAESFIAEVDPTRLANLEVLEVRPAFSEMEEDEFYQRLAARRVAIVGADDTTERVALISFEGERYLLGFTLYRYGAEWLVASQHSPLAGTNTVGIPQPVSE